MFKKIIDKLRFLNILLQNEQKNEDNQDYDNDFDSDLEKKLTNLKDIFGGSTDLVIRRFTIGADNKIPAAIIFIDGLVENNFISDNILKTLMIEARKVDTKDTSIKTNVLELISSNIITIGDTKKTKKISILNHGILSGDTAILIEGYNEVLLINTRNKEIRSVQEPDTEVMVRGPREGFVENLRINTSLLRRKIKDPNLIFEVLVLGRKTRTNVCIAYVKGIIREELVAEIKQRLKQIKTDIILESGYIEQFIEDNPFSPFATIANSERPDSVAAKLLEGRAAIITDGTPFVLTVPMLLVENFQVAEDYYSRPYYVTLIRWIRYISFLISILAPAVYVAIETYHQELIPTPLFITMAAAAEGTPFPLVLEAIMMGLVYEILREAGIRLPRPIGQAISIVGALVIGESAVTAGLIGAPMVIVVAITAISAFVVPALADATTIIRFILIILAGVLGGYGILLGLLTLLIHLSSLRSFGVPFLSPLAPLSIRDLKDVVIRAPLWAMFRRPESLENFNSKRQKFRLKPEQPPGNDK